MSFRLAAALVAVFALDRWLPLPQAEPLLGTLVLLPLIVVGLLEIGRWVAAQGAGGEVTEPRSAVDPLQIRTKPPVLGPGRFEAAALGLLVLLAFARPVLGPEISPRPLIAAFVVLLGLHVVRLTRALRPLLGDRLPRRPPAAFFFLPLLVYLAILPWSAGQRAPDGDEPYFLLITHSLAYDGDTELTDNYARGDSRRFTKREVQPQPGDPLGADGEQYSRHSPLLPLTLVPAYRIGGRPGAMAMMAIFAAALTWLMLRVAAQYFPEYPGAALATWAILAFTPPLLLYSQQIWTEVPAALLTLLALDRVLRLGDEREGAASWAAVILPIALLPLLKLRFALLAIPLLVLAALRSRRRRLVGFATVLLAAGGGSLLLYNLVTYGNALRYRSIKEISIFTFPAEDFVRGFVGLFFDCAFGLFAAAPIWWLLLPATLLLIAQRMPRFDSGQSLSTQRLSTQRHSPLLWHIALLTIPLLLFVTPRLEWYGGWSPPFRYGVAILPLLCLALIPLLARWRRSGTLTVAAVTALASLTLIVSLIYVVMPAWTYNLAHGRSQILDRTSLMLGADVARFFSSFVRPRAATWWWPSASLAVAGWMVWRLRRRSPATELRTGIAWGILSVLLLPAALPWAAHRVPTRVIEFEDRAVAHSGGRLYPKLWTVARPRFRGGWLLRPGTRISAPVAVGHAVLTLALDLRYFPARNGAPLVLRIHAGERLLASWPATACTPDPPTDHRQAERSDDWCTIRFTDLDWPAGEPLVVSLHLVGGTGKKGARAVQRAGGGSLIIDRARLDWGD